jgi:hypothetical protein
MNDPAANVPVLYPIDDLCRSNPGPMWVDSFLALAIDGHGGSHEQA